MAGKWGKGGGKSGNRSGTDANQYIIDLIWLAEDGIGGAITLILLLISPPPVHPFLATFNPWLNVLAWRRWEIVKFIVHTWIFSSPSLQVYIMSKISIWVLKPCKLLFFWMIWGVIVWNKSILKQKQFYSLQFGNIFSDQQFHPILLNSIRCQTKPLNTLVHFRVPRNSTPAIRHRFLCSLVLFAVRACRTQ